MSETLVQRAARFHALAMSLLPKGVAWARVSGSALSENLSALVYELARVEESADAYRTEMDPRQTTALLPEWESVLGLPDECGAPASTEGRRGAILARLTGGGTNKRAALDAAITAFDADSSLYAITHPTQFEVGTDGGGAGQPVGSDGWAHVVTLQILSAAASLDTDGLECVLSGIKRAHGIYFFEYYDHEATFRAGPDQTSLAGWDNAGDVDPLPAGLEVDTGTPTLTTVLGVDWPQFDGATTLATSDLWTDYVDTDAKWVVAVVSLDSHSTDASLVAGGVAGDVEWSLGVLDLGSGPELVGYSADGGAGILTTGIPLSLGVTHVCELLHAAGTMTVRAYDDINGWREESIAAPATVPIGAAEQVYVGYEFEGRMAHVETYGARGRVPVEAQRSSITSALIADYCDTPPFADAVALWLDLTSPDTSIVSGAVAQIGDRSGNARHFTQGVGTKHPAYTASDPDFGGRPSMSFDGVDDFLNRSGLPAWPQHTIVAVVRGGTAAFARYAEYSSGATYTALLNVSSTSARAVFTNGSQTYKDRAITAGATRRIVAAFDTATGATAIPEYYLDGVDQGATYTASAASNGPIAGSITMALGSNALGTAVFTNGKIAEVLMYDRALSDAEIVTVDAWVAARYGL